MVKLDTFHAGHNRFVTGAHALGYKEEVETRRVVARIAEICEESGINYAITTDNDGRTQRQNLNNIIANCNSHTRDRRDTAIHFNQGESEVGGVEVWYYDQRELAAKVSSAVASALGIRDRGPKQRKDLAVLNGTNAPAILIEVCFLGHAGNMQAYENNFDKMCRAIVTNVTGQAVTGRNEAPREDVHVTGSQGIVTVKVDTALIRTEPTTGSSINTAGGSNGRVYRGSEWQSWGSKIGEGGYTWYNLGNRMWIRGDLVNWRKA
ncbi:glycoside hydrolase family 25 [Bacillus thuringiensis]|uniref:N-acetylmuramoyl-L-alanine amidase n=1 Tax=Bacillus thuringiensis TaxID=1428 RepID=UPI000BF93F74|nr:N-acetylmuramoyl-L-alanine amidase [Bacillus thuringiensis]PFO25037.1 glycoside hydrolase family 25 [Bacillus thuringiensis]